MRVILPIAYYTPERCAGIYILHDVCEALACEGIDTLVITPTPTRNVDPAAAWQRRETHMGGHQQIRRFAMYGEGRNPLLRALRYALTEAVYLHHLLWDRYDVAFIDSTPPTQGLKLPLVKWLRRKPVVYCAQDVFPESLVAAGLTRRGSLLWKIGRRVADVTYRYADKIIVISADMRRTLVSAGVPEDKIAVVYNWIDEQKIRPVTKADNPLYGKYHLDPARFRVVYSGNLGHSQNIDVILRAASRLREATHIEFVLFGQGALEQEIRQRIHDSALANVRLLPFQPEALVGCVYSLGDLCLICSKPGTGRNSMPSKTWSILSAARPVLANFDEGELQAMIATHGFGLYTPADDDAALAQAILNASHEPQACYEMGQRGRAFVLAHLTKSQGTRRYVDLIHRLNTD